jgi:hypothetical protein
MKLIQEENFFPNLNFILPEIKKIKLYYPKEQEKLQNSKANWPGLRSISLGTTNPIFHEYIISLLQQKKLLDKGYWEVVSFMHLRLKEDDLNDWIHKDPDHFAALIYLSETNLNSGTYLYDEDENLINDIKFVKNRFIMYDGQYNHKGYGHHGDSIENGRLTINLFMNKKN